MTEKKTKGKPSGILNFHKPPQAEVEVKCPYGTCVNHCEIAGMNSCDATGCQPESADCPVYTPICPACNGAGHFSSREERDQTLSDMGPFVSMLREITNAALQNRNEVLAENARLKELTAQSVAVRWVSYDGSRNALPGIGETVLFDAGEDGTIVVYYRHHPVEGRTWGHFEPGNSDFQVEIGDRWAHLPAAPVAKED